MTEPPLEHESSGELSRELDLEAALAGPDWGSRRRRRIHGSGDGSVRRRSRRARRKTRRLRWILGGTGVFLVVVAGAAAWLAYSAMQAKHDLEAVRSGVQRLRQQISAGDLDGARATARDVAQHAHDAHDDTTGPVWAMAAAIPRLGSPLGTARTVTSSVDLLADHALTSLIDASDGLQPAQLRRPDGSFDLAPLEALAPRITSAQRTLTQALRELHGADGSTWSGAINSARIQLIHEIQQLQPTLTSAHRAASLVPTLLGADRARTYMLAFETGAEVRATGGIAGAFAILRADHGKLTFTRFEADTVMGGVQARVPSLGMRFLTLFQAAQADFRDSNYGPHFPYAAQIWSAMWKQKTGQTLDGVVAVDPTALSYLLAVTGPVTLHDGSQLTSANVVQLTQNTVYTRYPGAHQQQQRKQFQLDVAKTVSSHLLSARTDVTTLIKAAGRAADEHRLLVWTSDAPVEKQLADVPLGGAVPTSTTRPYLAVGLDNDSQSKLDYWLHAKVTWQRTSCGPTSDVTVTVQLTNGAPTPSTLPAYVLGNSDPPGESSSDVVVYGSVGARIVSRTVDGKPAQTYVPGEDLGHPVNIVTVNASRGHTATLVLHLKESYVAGDPLVRAQPLINPMQVTVLDACR